MKKEYKLAKTKGKFAKLNNLTPAESKYYSGNDLYYDFSLLDNIKFIDDDREIITKDFMEHHAVAWFEQPLPTIYPYGKWIDYTGQIRTAPHRVYKADGKRMCVVIEITGIKIERRTRKDVWSEYDIVEAVYEAKNGNYEYDIELKEEIA